MRGNFRNYSSKAKNFLNSSHKIIFWTLISRDLILLGAMAILVPPAAGPVWTVFSPILTGFLVLTLMLIFIFLVLIMIIPCFSLLPKRVLHLLIKFFILTVSYFTMRVVITVLLKLGLMLITLILFFLSLSV